MFKVRYLPALLFVALLGACVQRSRGHTMHVTNAADIVVTGSGPAAAIARGESAKFTIKVANAGPNDATNIKITETIGTQSELVSMTCEAVHGAVCPDTLGSAMTVPKLPYDGSLSFAVTLKLPAQATGTIVNSLSASSEQDGDPNNNSVAVDVAVR